MSPATSTAEACFETAISPMRLITSKRSARRIARVSSSTNPKVFPIWRSEVWRNRIVLNKVLRVKHMRFSPTVELLFRAYTPPNQAHTPNGIIRIDGLPVLWNGVELMEAYWQSQVPRQWQIDDSHWDYSLGALGSLIVEGSSFPLLCGKVGVMLG